MASTALADIQIVKDLARCPQNPTALRMSHAFQPTDSLQPAGSASFWRQHPRGQDREVEVAVPY